MNRKKIEVIISEMRSKIFIFLLISVLPLESVFGQIYWQNDFQTALNLSKETGKPLLLNFTAAWCLPCQKMEKNFWNRADVGEFSKQIIFVKIDGDKAAELKLKYGVKGFPTLILADSWGERLDSYVGFGQNADRVILEKFAAIPKDFASLKNAGNLREKNRDDLSALYVFADFYHEQKMYNFGIEIYKKILTLETEPIKRENAMLNLAFDQLKIGHLTAALENFEVLIKEFPKSPQNDLFLYGKISVLLNKGDLKESEFAFDRLKSEFPASQWTSEAEKRIAKSKSR